MPPKITKKLYTVVTKLIVSVLMSHPGVPLDTLFDAQSDWEGPRFGAQSHVLAISSHFVVFTKVLDVDESHSIREWRPEASILAFMGWFDLSPHSEQVHSSLPQDPHLHQY